MIKRNPLVKTKSQTARKKEVKELLSDIGMNFFDNKEWEQFEVWPMGDKRGGNSTYFTGNRSSEDLEDALQTGLYMAEKLDKRKANKAKNPRKCRTFQAKRKVGKRVIKVTRKVCRNPTERIVLIYGKLPSKVIYQEHFRDETAKNNFRYRITSPNWPKNKWDALEGSFSSEELWELLKKAIKEESDTGLDWASSVLETLNIEWV